MKRPTRFDALYALLAGIIGVAGSYVVAGSTRGFVVSPVDDQIVIWTPGSIVTYMIENVGEEAHLLHLGLAVAVVVGIFGSVALVGLRVSERFETPLSGGAVAGVGTWVLTVALTGEPILAAGPAVPVAVFTGVASLERPATGFDPSRRRTLGVVASVLALAGGAIAGGRFVHADEPLPDAPNSEGSTERIEAVRRQSLDTGSSELPGLVSSIDNFYNVDIATFDPRIPAGDWSLSFTGDIGTPQTITYDDLIERDIEHRAVTLRCVGEDLNGRKLDTAVWTGTPIRPLLEAADPEGECDCAMLRGRDDYYVQFPVDVLAEGFLAWGMNGKELPTSHGYPVRILIPGHWGETNVKWLTEIEMLETEEDGYWEERGWQGTGEVKTVAKLWEEGITELDDGRIELAGHAYAGTRGIDTVEVSIDGGETWEESELSEPLPDEDVWRQWRYTFEASGTHEAVVRAIDGEGNRQIRDRSDPSPTGASGWVRRTIDG